VIAARAVKAAAAAALAVAVGIAGVARVVRLALEAAVVVVENLATAGAVRVGMIAAMIAGTTGVSVRNRRRRCRT